MNEGDLNPDNKERRENKQRVYISQGPVSTLTSSLSQSPERVTHLECHQTLPLKEKARMPTPSSPVYTRKWQVMHPYFLSAAKALRACLTSGAWASPTSWWWWGDSSSLLWWWSWLQVDGKTWFHGDENIQLHVDAEIQLQSDKEALLEKDGKPKPILFSEGISGWLSWPLRDADIWQDFIMTDRGESPAIKV